jgi:putative glutamine amidotransferase
MLNIRSNFFTTLLIIFLLFTGANSADRPLIGITSIFQTTEADPVGKVRTNMSYINAVLESGGLPVVLPPVKSEDAIASYVADLDGLVLVGGMDIPPRIYGEKAHETVDSLTTERFWFESHLIKNWLASEKPVLGVCLGCQFTNVMSGGTMIQDIPSEVGKKVVHRKKGGASHLIELEKSTRLYSILGVDTLTVNSYHHQAVDKIGNNLHITARAQDGIVEGLEFPGERFGLFVQWHPERLPKAHRQKIFGAFVKACK